MPKYNNELVTFDCEVKDSTDKAWLLVIDDKEVWVPKSIGQLEHDGKIVDDVLLVPTWFAEEEELG